MKKIITGAISLFVIYILYCLSIMIIYVHHFDAKIYQSYIWLLKEPVRKRINPLLSNSYIGNSDVYNFINCNKLYVQIWELKKLKSVRLQNISINKNVNLNDVKTGFGETINVDENPEISIKYGFSFGSSLNVNLNESSKIIKMIDSVNYKGFYGIINKMSFSDDERKHLILFNYPNGELPTLLLFYKTNNSFYLLMVDSKNPIDESMVQMFNLN